MIVDCDLCAMQHTKACDDCVVSFILGNDAHELEFSEGEMAALRPLAEAGLVPRLRLIPRTGPRPIREAG